MALGTTISAAANAATADEIRRSTQEVLSDPHYQQYLPYERTKPQSQPVVEPKPYADRLPSDDNGFSDDTVETPRWLRDERGEPDSSAPWAPGVGRVLLWLFVLVGAATLIFYLLNALPLIVERRRERKVRKPSTPAPAAAETSTAAEHGSPLAGPDRFAGEGNYGEAAHAILLLSLELIRRQVFPVLEPSLTSREVVARVSLKDGAKSAFTVIVGAVERSRFGGRALSERDYLACRENYLRLAAGGASL